MELKFKRLDTEKAIMPIRAYKGDAGLDLTATDITLEPNECGQTVVVYHTGLAVEIPEGYVGLLFPRSSIAKKSMFLTNCVGVIDSGYRGEITAKMHITTDAAPAIYKVGEKFMQLIVMPFVDIDIVESADLSESDRGEGGYGSSDKDIRAGIFGKDISAGDSNSADPTTEVEKSADSSVTEYDQAAAVQAEVVE